VREERKFRTVPAVSRCYSFAISGANRSFPAIA
jgi:hypothetical protein